MRTEYLMEKEVERVLMALMPSNRLVCRVCLHTGLRVSDVLELRPWQIARQFWIVEKKTGKRRRVNLTDKLVSEMRSESGGTEWVFPGRDYRKHRTRQAVWQDVKRAQRRSGCRRTSRRIASGRCTRSSCCGDMGISSACERR